MKIILSLILILFLAACDDKEKSASSSQINQNTSEKENFNPNLAFDLNLINGMNLNMQKRQGGFDIKNDNKATLFVFFATWCPPCKAEIPHLNNLAEKFKDNLKIVGVLMEDIPLSNVKDFVQKYQIKYDVSVGNNNFLFAKILGGVSGIPYSLLYRPNGDYATRYVGLVPEEMLQSDITKVIL